MCFINLSTLLITLKIQIKKRNKMRIKLVVIRDCVASLKCGVSDEPRGT